MKFTILFAILIMGVNLGHGQSLDKADLDIYFDRLAGKDKAMGSLVIAKDGKTLYERAIGYGQVSQAAKMPLTARSKFRIGSITKMFTAALFLQLTEQGKVKLTDTLNRFFPQIQNAEKITIEQLLWHRSGIGSVTREPNPERNAATIPSTKDEMLSMIAKTAPEFAPDTKRSYSNSGYQVLGLIIEKITGKSYGDVLREKITSKIGLSDTYLATGNIYVCKNEALSYMNFGNGWKPVPETHPSILFSSGGIVSTAHDLTRFMLALFDGKIVSKASVERMKTIRDGEGSGMEAFTLAGKTFYGHTGGVDNYGAWLAYRPEERLAVAYVTNAKVYPVADLVSDVFEIYYDRPFEIPTFESIAVTTEILDKYVGDYSTSGAPVKIKIIRKDQTLYFQPGNETAVPLEATSTSSFKIDNGTREGIVFEFDAAKDQMTIKRNGGQRIFKKED